LQICSTLPAKKISSRNENKQMMKLPKRTVQLLIVLCLMVVAVRTAQASTLSINIKPGKSFVQTLQLAYGDQVTLSFRVLGSPPTTLHLSVVLPNGTTIDYGTKSQGSVSFFTDVEGECQLDFENNSTSDTQLLTLDYDVEHYILGMPMLLFVLLAIAVLLVFVVAGYIIMGKYGA
jgi:hypothetical protein